MQEILPGVFLVPQNGGKGFGYSHFVRRPAGNLLLDASRVGSLSDAFDAMDAAGGVQIVVISDRHLGGLSTNALAQRFGARVYCSAIEADAMGHRSNQVHVDHLMAFERSEIAPDVWLIPTPGHTPGQFSTLATVDGARILFTADFCWREGGRWRPGNLSRKAVGASFEALRDLVFDYVVPWTAYGQDETHVAVRDVQKTLDEMIAGCTKP